MGSEETALSRASVDKERQEGTCLVPCPTKRQRAREVATAHTRTGGARTSPRLAGNDSTLRYRLERAAHRQYLGFHEQSVRRHVKAYLADGFDGLAPRPYLVGRLA